MRDVYAWTKYHITTDWLALTGGVLANVGCGSGEFNLMALDLGFSVIACEPDPAAFEIADDPILVLALRHQREDDTQP